MLKQGLLILLLPPLAFQGTSEKAAIDKEWKSLHGKWILELIEVGGARVKPDLKIWAVVEHEKFTMTDGRGKEVVRMTIKPKYSPKFVDWQESGPAGKKVEGIYDIGQDRLRICIFGQPTGEQRPTEFTTRKGDKLRLFYFQRLRE